MTEENRSRRPSSARPRRTPRTGTAAAGAGAGQVAELSEPSLGDVSFDEWFETPVFESDPDERLEELATSRRGPLRLAASTFLRLNARASQVRRRTDDAEILGADALRAVDPAPVFEEVEAPPAPRRAGGSGPAGGGRVAPANGKTAINGRTATTKGKTATANGKVAANGRTATTNGRAAAAAPRTGAAPKAGGKATSAGTGAAPKAGGKTAARAASTGTGAARRATAATAANGKPTASARRTAGAAGARRSVASTISAPPPPAVPDGPGAAGESVAPLRQRLAQALDRWAEREAATQMRLERMILPKRWQA